MKVSAVVPAFNNQSDLPTVTAPRASNNVDKLSKAVGDALGIEVAVIEGSLADAPADGYLLAFQLRHDDDPQLGPRIIAFNEDRASVMETVESFNLAGAVEKLVYSQWSRQGIKRGYGLIGRKDVAERMGAHVHDGPYTRGRYALLSSDAAADLPELIGAYLRTYAQIVAIE